MSALSDYLNAHLPIGWTKRDVVRALQDVLDRTTVYRYLAGSHSRQPPEYVLEAFAAVLPSASLVGLREAAGAAAGEEEPYIPPVEANRLTRTQRDAIDALIRSIVAGGSDPASRQGPRSPGMDMRTAERPPTPEADADEVRAFAARLRRSGQIELAERLEASIADKTSSVSATPSSSSTE